MPGRWHAVRQRAARIAAARRRDERGGVSGGVSGGGDGGESLIEVLVAVTIMGIALVAIAGAFVTYVLVSDVHRKQTTAAAGARAYAEQLVTFTAGTGYQNCATPTAYQPATVGYAAPTGYAAAVSSVRYGVATGVSFGATCSTDTGLQQVTVRVSTSDGRAAETVTVVLRRPCGTGSTCTS